MPDIAMCKGEGMLGDVKRVCPRAKECYRHTAKPTPLRQSYFAILPMALNGECSYFWHDQVGRR